MKARKQPLFPSPLAAFVFGLAITVTTARAQTTLFTEDFESPVVAGYSQGTTPPTKWVRAAQGYNSSYHGLINEAVDGLGTGFEDPTGDQAYAFRYTNSGLTSAAGKIGALQLGVTYTVTVDVARDVIGVFGGLPLPYTIQLIAFAPGAARDDVRSTPTGSVVLASKGGSATADGLYSTVTFSFTANYTNAANLGYDLGVRFVGGADTANVDNMKVEADFSNVAFWDTSGATEGAGGASPSGTWDAATTNWNPDPAGTGTAAVWSPGRLAVFAAGADATGSYTVTVDGSQNIKGLIVEEGSINLANGTSGALNLTSNSDVLVPSGSTVTIGTPITDADDTQVLQKVGSGLLVVSADNSAANGGIQITGGTMQFESPSSINGSGLKVTVNAGGTMVFGPTFGSANIPTALLERVVDGSAGTIAADNYSSTDFDFATAFKSAAFLGAVGNLSYTGTVTPNGSTYRLGGGGGTLTMAEPNALTGVGASAVVRGNVTLAAANDLDGGITLNSGWLQLGNDASLGGGPLATNGGRVSSADTTARTLANALDVNANLALGDATNNGTLTFTGGVDISGATRTFTTNSDVEFAGIVSGGNALTKAGAATLTLSGDNTYTGTTTVDGGILVFSGSNNSAGATTLNGATLQLDSDSNGGLASGLLTISQNAGVLQAINEDRVIANNVSLNSSPTISGSQSLTINGTLTLNNNRILTNSITGTGKLLTIAAISRDGTNNRNLTVSGDGDTTVTGGVTLGTGTLTKNGAGTLTLQGANSYTGATTVNTGGTLALVGGSQDSPITVNSGAFLGFTLDSPTTSTKALNLNTGHAIRITGTPTLASYTLITAASIGGTGTPTLAAPIAGYELVVDGTSLKLNIGGGSAYDTWKAQITNGQDLRTDDAEGDGFTNLQEFLFGTSPIAGSGSLVTTTASGGNLVLRWLQLETGATYTLKQSSTLVAGSWTTAAQSPAIDANQTGAPTGYDYYSVSIPTGGGRMFFRIEGVEN